ncbi:hypothetical protein [Candidatus Albibeggiatoa sp. nov. NOAA]|uniref:hypothetical protein n=1 Tax=Candidatus Albibeggiatoa sp. nov. NOAA TaxID=3162724 RepID=UPI0032F2EDA1|nr:hypothetical protein [Thiotrichaceae bacterium]
MKLIIEWRMDSQYLRYKDAYYLVPLGGGDEYDGYCFSSNLELEKGELEIWFVSGHEMFMGYDWCYKFQNFTKFAEYLLIG